MGENSTTGSSNNPRCRKRQVPIFVPLAILAIVFIGIGLFCLLNPFGWQAVAVFPLGLMFFSTEHISKKIPDIPLAIAAYAIYAVLLLRLLFVRKWISFGVVCIILIGVFLINLAGCQSVLQSLSNIH